MATKAWTYSMLSRSNHTRSRAFISFVCSYARLHSRSFASFVHLRLQTRKRVHFIFFHSCIPSIFTSLCLFHSAILIAPSDLSLFLSFHPLANSSTNWFCQNGDERETKNLIYFNVCCIFTFIQLNWLKIVRCARTIANDFLHSSFLFFFLLLLIFIALTEQSGYQCATCANVNPLLIHTKPQTNP